jgi:hypothetical protein
MRLGYYIAVTRPSMIVQSAGDCKSSIQQYLISSNYAIYDPPPSVSVVPYSPDDLIGAWTSDISRFSVSCFETMASIASISDLPRSLAWACIKAYYAAFFSAHALLRLSGHALSMLAVKERDALRAIGRIYLGSLNLDSGVHALCLSANAQRLFIESDTEASSHLPVWQAFDSLLGDFESSLSALPETPEVQEAVGALSDLRSYLRSRSGASYLSITRNSINYQQLFEVWFPYGRKAPDAARALRIIGQWKSGFVNDQPLPKGDNAALILLDLSVRIVRLFREVIIEVGALHLGERSFLERRALPLLRLVGAA